MTHVNISEAASLAGISRQHLYKKYIKTGLISVERHYDVPKIQVSELLRVFGELQPTTAVDKVEIDNSLQKLTVKNVNDYNELQLKLAKLQTENEQLRERISDKESHLRDLRESLKLLENRKPRKSFFGLFS
jgi:hypothetical protein